MAWQGMAVQVWQGKAWPGTARRGKAMEREEIISRMNELSDRLYAVASVLMSQENDGMTLAANVMMNIANCIDDVFDDYDTSDCEGEA